MDFDMRYIYSFSRTECKLYGCYHWSDAYISFDEPYCGFGAWARYL